MPIVRVKGLRREDYAQAPAWFDALLFTLNQALGDIGSILNGGVTFADNHLAELKTVEVTMPAEFPTWRVVGATGQPPFENSFTQWVGGGGPNVSFRMWPNGVVELRGMIKVPAIAPPAFTTMFTLPAGYRPPLTLRFILVAGYIQGNIEINAAGQVGNAGAGGGGAGGNGLHLINNWGSFDGVRFQALGAAAKPDPFGAPFPMMVKTSGRFGVKTCDVVQVVDKTDNAGGPIGAATVDWAPDKAGVKLNAIWGLQPGRKYDVTFLLTAG